MSQPNFKELIQQDINTTFLNPNEFGEEVTINNSKMVVVIDEKELEKQNIANDGKLAKGELLFHVNKSNFKGIPTADRLMEFEGKKYRIIKSTDNLGMLTIMLARNDG